MLLDFANKWNPGDIIGVKFLNGNKKLKERVEAAAKTWEQNANIKFNFGAEDASIRIKFGSPSNDSKIGTEFLTFSDPVTMNFANMHADTSEDELQHKILHEFGHALGLVHEHFHPNFSENLNREQTMQHFKRTVGLSEAEIEQNVFKQYCPNQLYYSEFDPDSIMTYEIPSDCTADGRAISRNHALSEIDKQFISKIYPFETIQPEELEKDISTDISLNMYEEKIFKITVIPSEQKRYYITTIMDNPVALSLYRIENEGEKNKYIDYIEPFDKENDSIGTNAKLEFEEYVTAAKPTITEYFVRICCVHPIGISDGIIKLEVV